MPKTLVSGKTLPIGLSYVHCSEPLAWSGKMESSRTGREWMDMGMLQHTGESSANPRCENTAIRAMTTSPTPTPFMGPHAAGTMESAHAPPYLHKHDIELRIPIDTETETYIYIYVILSYIYKDRERERERCISCLEQLKLKGAAVERALRLQGWELTHWISSLLTRRAMDRL